MMEFNEALAVALAVLATIAFLNPLQAVPNEQAAYPPITPAATPTPTPAPVTVNDSTTTTSLPELPQDIPQNFIVTWNMSSLEYLNEPSSSFPEPPDKVTRTNDSLITLEGKPLIILFTTPYCQYSKWERPVFQEVTSKFGTWSNVTSRTVSANLTNGSTLVTTYPDLASATFESEYLSIKAVEIEGAPFQYQPLFTRYSPQSQVPTIVFGGIYVKIGSSQQYGALDAQNRLDEGARLTSTICSLLNGRPRPAVCPS